MQQIRQLEEACVYFKKVGRLTLEVPRDHEGRPVLSIPDGWNDSVPVIHNELTREELHDLRYMIDRAIAAINSEK